MPSSGDPIDGRWLFSLLPHATHSHHPQSPKTFLIFRDGLKPDLFIYFFFKETLKNKFFLSGMKFKFIVTLSRSRTNQFFDCVSMFSVVAYWSRHWMEKRRECAYIGGRVVQTIFGFFFWGGGWGLECQRPLMEKRGQWGGIGWERERTGLLTAGLPTTHTLSLSFWCRREMAEFVSAILHAYRSSRLTWHTLD